MRSGEVVAQSIPPWLVEDDELFASLRDLLRAWMASDHPHRLRILGLERIEEGWALLTQPEPPFHVRAFASAAARLPVADRVGWTITRVVELADAVATLGEVHGEIAPRALGFEPDGGLTLLPPLPRVTMRRSFTGRSPIEVGSISWMPPELCAGSARVEATDVYALAYLARALLGAPDPWATAKSDIAILQAKMRPDPLPSLREVGIAVDPALDEVLSRALAFERSARFASARELAAALAPFARDDASVRARLVDEVRSLGEGATRVRRKLPMLQGVVQRPCSKRWEELAPTAREEVRHCSECQLTVQRVRTAAALLPLGGSCVFYDPDLA